MNTSKICTTCGTQFPISHNPPELCPICDDDRQYIPEKGQTWTDPDDLSDNYAVLIKKVSDTLYELRMTPSFGIGQRAFLILTPGGNILWDCIPLLNEPTIAFIRAKGGLKAIAFSHPHYYSNMQVWAEAFDCPIYIHKKDEQWIMYKSDRIRLWSGTEQKLWDNITIINIGGHFPGSSVLHIPFFPQKGSLLCGDTLYISRSKKHIAVMHSYPNQIPLSLNEMNRIHSRVKDLEFDALYGAFDFQDLPANAKILFITSMKKYVQE